MPKYRLIFDQRRQLVTDLCLTAVVRDIKSDWGDEVAIEVRSLWPEVWDRNPHVGCFSLDESRQAFYIPVVPGKGEEHPLPSLYAQIQPSLPEELQSRLRCKLVQPDLHLSIDEQHPRQVRGNYWLLVPLGEESRGSVRYWPAGYWSALADELQERKVKIAQSSEPGRISAPLLSAAVDRRDLSLRSLFALVQQSDGVICSSGDIAHIAAAFGRPAVVIGGGYKSLLQESYQENGGPAQRYLHVLGQLPCCSQKACGYKTIVGDGTEQAVTPDGCTNVVSVPAGRGAEETTELVSLCQTKIDVFRVVQAVESFRPLRPIRRSSPIVVSRPSGVVRAAAGPLQSHDSEIFDHPIIGSKFTIFVLLYGGYTDLARRCLQSIIETVPRHRRDLRVAANVVHDDTKEYLRSLGDELTTVYYQTDPAAAVKYPVMRRMFRDSLFPISTPYTLWFDDDSHCVQSQWLEELSRAIVAAHPNQYRLFGVRLRHPSRAPRSVKPIRMWPPRPAAAASTRPVPDPWFRSAAWWQDRYYRNELGDWSPNGGYTYFAAGGWWAIHTPVIEQADIPDIRLWHNGGDVTIGEQVNQAGYRCWDINRGNGLVLVSDAARRGSQSPFPWHQAAMQAYAQQPK